MIGQSGDSSSSEHTSEERNLDTPSTGDENFDVQGLPSMLPTSEVEPIANVAEQQVGVHRPSATDGSFERSVMECNVCMETFSINRRPKCLPCAHKVCEPCLNGMIARNMKECHLCREPFSATGIPTDTLVEHMLQLAQDQSLVVQDTQHKYTKLVSIHEASKVVSTQESSKAVSTSERSLESAIVNIIENGSREGVNYSGRILTTTGGARDQTEKSENKSEQTSSNGGKTSYNQQQEKTLGQQNKVVKSEYISVGHDQGAAIKAIQAMEDKEMTHKLELEKIKLEAQVAADKEALNHKRKLELLNAQSAADKAKSGCNIQ